MDTLFDILQALGIGAAVGIRPFLPALLVAALASANLGIDFDGTAWAFLEQPPFLIALVALVIVADIVRRRAGDGWQDVAPGRYIAGVVAGVLGGMLGAGSLADHGGPVIVGIVLGAVTAVAALMAVGPLFTRVRKRLDSAAAGLLPLYREGVALLSAAASVLFPPLALLVVGGLVWLGLGSSRRDGEKYAGLRILR